MLPAIFAACAVICAQAPHIARAPDGSFQVASLTLTGAGKPAGSGGGTPGGLDFSITSGTALGLVTGAI